MTTGAAKLAWENSRAQNGSLLVLMAIAFEFEDKGNCIMTVAELAGKARLSERAVQAATADLTGLGELTVTRRAEGHRNGYCLLLPRGAESAPLPAGSPAESAPPQNLHPAESAPLEQEAAGQDRGAESAPPQISDKRSTTGLPVVEKPSSAPRPDADRLCTHLADRITSNGSKRPNITKRWKDAARLLIDNDGRTEDQVHKAIDWCQDDEFWRTNILSMPKLREKYDQLRLKATQQRKPSTRTNPDDDYEAAMARIRARKENGNGTGGNGHDSPARQVSLPAAAD